MKQIVNENKRKICELLLPAVQATRGGADVTALEYFEEGNGDEVVYIRFKSGFSYRACVTADSGLSMIRDIMKEL